MRNKKTGIKIMLVFAIFFATMWAMIYIYLSQMRYVKLPGDDENLGIQDRKISIEESLKESPEGSDEKSPEREKKKDAADNEDMPIIENEELYNKAYELEDKIINIALIGGDRRNKKEPSHGDSIIVLSIDNVHKKIKLSSIMRDTYVKVHGVGKTKLSHAYAYGGPALTIRTLNENFNLNIRDYVFVDFYGFEKLIDALGGVEVEVKKNEINEINKYIKEAAQNRKTKAKLLKKAGMQTLNGQQALAYSRIRKVGNGDFTRTNRQRQVLDVVIKKINEKGPFQFPKLAAQVLPYVETSMSKTDIIKTGIYVLTSGIDAVEQRRFPMDGYCKGKIIDKIWYLVADIEATKRQMREFIYEKQGSS